MVQTDHNAHVTLASSKIGTVQDIQIPREGYFDVENGVFLIPSQMSRSTQNNCLKEQLSIALAISNLKADNPHLEILKMHPVEMAITGSKVTHTYVSGFIVETQSKKIIREPRDTE